MYKVECTKREAEIIGEVRWKKGNERRYLWWAVISVLAGVGAAVGSVVTDTPTSGWNGGPVSLVLLVAALVLMGAAFFFMIRMSILFTKAGKKFVQSLKEEPEK